MKISIFYCKILRGFISFLLLLLVVTHLPFKLRNSDPSLIFHAFPTVELSMTPCQPRLPCNPSRRTTQEKSDVFSRTPFTCANRSYFGKSSPQLCYPFPSDQTPGAHHSQEAILSIPYNRITVHSSGGYSNELSVVPTDRNSLKKRTL